MSMDWFLRLFVWRHFEGETSGGVAKCRLFSQASSKVILNWSFLLRCRLLLWMADCRYQTYVILRRQPSAVCICFLFSSVNCRFKQVCCSITLRLHLNIFENAVLKSRDLNPYVTGCIITSIMINKTTPWENQSGMNLGPTIASRKQQVNAGK